MGTRRFSVTTYILVGISLVALYFVGKTVNPPPVGPAKEIAPVRPSAAETSAQAMKRQQEEEMRAKEQAKMVKEYAAHSKKTTIVSKGIPFNPTGIDTGNEYWQRYGDGKKGVDAMQEKVKKALADQKQSTPRTNKPVRALPIPAP
jgi:hypothetical protein